jgi:hypothetical protein
LRLKFAPQPHPRVLLSGDFGVNESMNWGQVFDYCFFILAVDFRSPFHGREKKAGIEDLTPRG